MGDNFLKLEGWEELSGCDDPRFIRDCGGEFGRSLGPSLVF